MHKHHLFFVMVIFIFITNCKKDLSRVAKSGDSSTAIAQSLFKDQPTFNIEDVKKGQVCASVRNDNIRFIYKEWPQDIKNLLAQELSQFPLFEDISDHAEGFYLAEFVVEGDIDYKGLTCHDTKTNKYVVFINNSVIDIPRDNNKIDVDAYVYDARIKGVPVLEGRGDGAIQTLIHESFHVIDLAYYWEDLLNLMTNREVKDLENANKRLALMKTSWDSETEANLYSDVLYQDKKIALSSQASFKFPLDHIEQGQKEIVLFNLDSENKYDRLIAHRALLGTIAEKTNFVSYYALPNFIEDFAVTLEKYYLGMKYDMYERVEIFPPLEPYSFPAEELLNGDTPQRKKTCLFVETVLKKQC